MHALGDENRLDGIHPFYVPSIGPSFVFLSQVVDLFPINCLAYSLMQMPRIKLYNLRVIFIAFHAMNIPSSDEIPGLPTRRLLTFVPHWR